MYGIRLNKNGIRTTLAQTMPKQQILGTTLQTVTVSSGKKKKDIAFLSISPTSTSDCFFSWTSKPAVGTVRENCWSSEPKGGKRNLYRSFSRHYSKPHSSGRPFCNTFSNRAWYVLKRYKLHQWVKFDRLSSSIEDKGSPNISFANLIFKVCINIVLLHKHTQIK